MGERIKQQNVIIEEKVKNISEKGRTSQRTTNAQTR
jgi:hypothetical protein